MIYFLALLIFLIVAARASGGGFGAEWLQKRIGWGGLPEILFAAPFGVTLGVLTGEWWLGVLGWAWSFLWMETGHGVVLPWGQPIPDGEFKDELIGGRKQTLTPVVNFLAQQFGISTDRPDGIYSVGYCRLFMAVKGFLIGLPAGGLLLVVLWPACYEVGARLRGRTLPIDPHALTECLTGAVAAVTIGLTWVVII